MTRYEECADPAKLAAWRAAHGEGSVEYIGPEDETWMATAAETAGAFAYRMTQHDHRFRLVIEDPEPTPTPRTDLIDRAEFRRKFDYIVSVPDIDAESSAKEIVELVRVMLDTADVAAPSLPEGAPADAVPVDWFDQPAFVVPPRTEPVDGWETLSLHERWVRWNFSTMARVVRPIPVPEPPATVEITPTPETLHELIGRVVDGETIERVEQDRYGWSAYFVGGGPHLGARWDEHWSVTVLADPSGGVR